MARPLIEVFTVAIFPKSLPCQVYGDISVYDKDGDTEQTYMLYERDIEHPELVSENGQALLLTGPNGVLSMPKPVICIQLMHRSNDHNKASFVSGTCRLDNTTKDDYEAFKYCLIEGECGVARVNYAAMACAVVARVSIVLHGHAAQKYKELLSSSPKYSSKCFPCFGSVVARYGKTYAPQTFDIPALYLSSTILKTQQNEFIPLEINTYGDVCLKLTKRLVAVPAYSSLIITADLKEQNTNKQILHGTVDLTASSSTVDGQFSPMNIISEYAFMYVSWFTVPELQPSCVIDRSAYNLVGWSNSESLLEVYSVFIGRDNDAELSISGKIRVCHSDGFPCIYHRECNNADKLLRGKKLLSFTGPSEIIPFHEFFDMHVDLRDASDRFLIDGGMITFNSGMVRRDKLLYNKLLCSVIQGKGGYCAVHYTNFRKAVRLQVKCVVSYKSSVDVAKVYGSIAASYDMFKYTFEYDRKYFRRFLFDKPEDNEDILRKVVSKKTDDESCCSDEHKLNEVPFSTSYVAMPVGYALFIDVDVYVSSHQRRGPAEHFERTLRYVLGDKSPMEIKGEEFDILVYAEMMPTPPYSEIAVGLD